MDAFDVCPLCKSCFGTHSELCEKFTALQKWAAEMEEFIKNGYDLGYITVPEDDDPAYLTLGRLGCVPR